MNTRDEFKERTEQTKKINEYSNKLKKKKPSLGHTEPTGKINKSKKDY